MKLFANQICEYTQGQAAREFAGTGIVKQVTIDSRQLADGSLFVALRGERSDGHDYVAQVVANPLNYALVEEDFAPDLPNVIRVADTVLALGQLAAAYRQQFNLPVVALTGSNGKTSIKEMLRSVCQQHFAPESVLATEGNLNNHLGLPLTLLHLETQHQVAILELGMNHSGELDYLTRLAQPNIAAINNVLLAHAGHFASLAEIAAAKGEIFNGLATTGIACVNLANQFSQSWLATLHSKGVNVFGYGTVASGCYLAHLGSAGAIYETPLGELKIKLKVLGEHNYQNALTVIALALQLGCSLSELKAGLENYAGYARRLELKPIFNGATLVDDTYNANPDSVRAALAAVQGLAKPLWLIFADLKELGTAENETHRELGREFKHYGISRLLTVGELAHLSHQEFSGDKIHFASNQDIVEYCLSHLPSAATVLVKGSNSMRLREVADQLTTFQQLRKDSSCSTS